MVPKNRAKREETASCYATLLGMLGCLPQFATFKSNYIHKVKVSLRCYALWIHK